ncbi:IS66 family transposase, partial [Arcticibacter svalbardensis]|uniref:IS66 family transposase n=1 Tax=Arcticibacter svalbardensis TaxID=1288027 RepID=UPI001267F0BC
NDQKRAAYALDVFGQLYDIERDIKDKSSAERKEARQKLAKPIWENFGRWLEENAGLIKENSAIYKAFAYTMKRHKRLSVYMENGMLNIDNNPIESSIRPIALGRRNFLFSGSHDGAQRSAMLYSFMGTCKLHGINPMTWMEDVLKRINTHPSDKIHELLPPNWKKLQEETLEEKQENTILKTA